VQGTVFLSTLWMKARVDSLSTRSYILGPRMLTSTATGYTRLMFIREKESAQNYIATSRS